HFYAHMETERALPVLYNLAELIEGYRTLYRLASSKAHAIPGRDPLVIERYPPASEATRGWVARLALELMTCPAAMRFTTLVGRPELRRRLDDPGWRIFDCRFSLADPAAGRAAYREGHIPGALHADIDEHLSGPHLPGVTGRHPLPSREAWIATV